MKFQFARKIGLNRAADLAGLAASWFVVGSFFPLIQTAPGIYVIWVLLTSLLSLLTLEAIGYYEHHIPKPELSGLVSLLFALPLSGFLAKWLMMLTSNIPPVRYSEVLWASLAVALISEVAQLVLFRIHRALGARWTLVTHLHPDELTWLRDQVEASGAAWWINIHPYDASRPFEESVFDDETHVISRRAVHKLTDSAHLLAAHLRGREIVDLRQLLKEFRGRIDLHRVDAWSYLMASTHQNFLIRVYFFLKTLLEPLLALGLLVLLSPFLIGIALAIFFTSGAPILYRQERSGYRGKPFFLYKFRSMGNGAEHTGAQWASTNDPRVTPLGAWLRRTRIDELPQLFNVLKGELGFVGPRPERPEFYRLLERQVPLFSMRLLVRPGITGWAQVKQGYAASIEECRTKLEYDLYYVQHMSPQLDLRVILSTITLLLHGNSGR